MYSTICEPFLEGRIKLPVDLQIQQAQQLNETIKEAGLTGTFILEASCGTEAFAEQAISEQALACWLGR